MKMGFALALVLVFGLLLIGAPIALNVTHHEIGGFSSSFMVASGILLVVTCAVLLTITKLYVKTRASEAFVRTGMGGLKVIRDGGAIVLPVVHQYVRVSLETVRLDVERKGADALITADKLRADIKSEFFVRVQPDDESIQSAARSLGDKMDDPRQNVAKLIEDKLVSALRTAAARKTLEQLNSERDEFLKEVTQLVSTDLNHNGFKLETVTISKLDQTDEQHLKANNIFDAQGMRTIAEITQKNLTERNEIVRKGEQARTAQDVTTRKQVLELERAKAEAEAAQTSQIAVIEAEQQRIAQEKQIATQQALQVAQVEQQKIVEVAKRAQARDIEIAEKAKLQAVTEADQKVEVAKRAQQQAVAVAEAEKAQAEARLAEAEAERQKARQQVITVEQIATAEREKAKAVLAAKAEAEKQYVTAEKAADAAAYKTKTEADARKASADADAEATRKRAQAEMAAQQARAEGDKAQKLAEAEGTRARLLAEAEGQKAVAMVPIEVRAREVEVDKQRVEEVLKPELEARAQSGSVAQDFELAKFRIEKEAEVRIESAKATAQIYGKITANVYGTPKDVARMGDAFARGMGISQAIEGFLSGASEGTQEAAKKLTEVAVETVTAVTEKVKGGSSNNLGAPPIGHPST
jgi:uncharacterized membrane protein YqiK